MENIHILPTDKPSRLGYLTKKGKEVFNDLRLFEKPMPNILDSENQNIYITSDEEIKEGDWFLCLNNGKCNNSIYKANQAWLNMEEKQPSYCKKIILTTDQDLIKNGVQAIDDEFLEWFVKNPSCEVVEIEKTAPIRPFGSLYKVIIPKPTQQIIDEELGLYDEPKTKCYCGHTTYCDCGPEEPKQETLLGKTISKKDADKDSFEDVTNYKIERSYSDMQEYAEFCIECDRKQMPLLLVQDWYEHYKNK